LFIRDSLGFLRKSRAQDGLVEAGTLGAFICRDPLFHNTFTVRGRISDSFALQVWQNQSEFLGKHITYKYLEMGSTALAPRSPIFHSIRIKEDMPE